MTELLDIDATPIGRPAIVAWADDNAGAPTGPRPHASAEERSRGDVVSGPAARAAARPEHTDGPAILVGVGAPATDVVIDEAARIARELGGTLHVVAGYRPASASERERTRRQLPAGLSLDCDDDRLLEARDALEDAGETAAAKVPVRLHLERGDLVAGLCRVACREEALLIVAASPTGRMSGRADARLVNLAPCQVRRVEVGAKRRNVWRGAKKLRSRSRDRTGRVGDHSVSGVA